MMNQVTMAGNIMSQRHGADTETANRECLKRLLKDFLPARLEFFLLGNVMIADDGDTTTGILLDVLGMIALSRGRAIHTRPRSYHL